MSKPSVYSTPDSPPPSYRSRSPDVESVVSTPPRQYPPLDPVSPFLIHSAIVITREEVEVPVPLKPQSMQERPVKVGRSFLILLGAAFVALFIAQNFGVLPILLDDVPASQKAAIRKQWISEQKEHSRLSSEWTRDRAAYEEERAKWAEERVKWEEDRRNEERHRKEVERRRQGVYWTEPRDAHCHAYQTRVYRAILKDVPSDLNWLEVCSDMPITIHGRILDKPTHCYRGGNGDIYGAWNVDFNEPSCVPYWGSLSDASCATGGKGNARVEAQLLGIAKGDSWEQMCATTPAVINGVRFDNPTSCDNKGVFGIVGIWDYPAPWCN